LHIGVPTFTPVREIEKHSVGLEYYTVPAQTAEKVNEFLSEGGRLFAVGTSVLRTLETVYSKYNKLIPFSGYTELFIKPGYTFKTPLTGFITNFHLPKSPPLLMTAALAGCENLMYAYKVALENQYLFYSLGDAMLILRS
jgi:S-adenosylmethionine:tRNA ribosyltransferase-isomerase